MIFYFSGTGNSLRTATRLAEALPDKLVRMPGQTPSSEELSRETYVGFVFPVYAWGLPQAVTRYLRKMPRFIGETRPYVYAVLTCGDDVGYTDALLLKELSRAGLALQAVFSVQMRNTYVCLPAFDVDGAASVARKEAAWPARIAHIVETVRRREPFSSRELHRGSLPHLKTYVLRPLFNRFLIHDSRFHVSETDCIGCALCAKVCPVHNITMRAGEKPRWNGACTHCLACYHVCPRHAVAYGRWTRRKGQVKVENAACAAFLKQDEGEREPLAGPCN